jgi:molybdate transport system substrate-binding protein
MRNKNIREDVMRLLPKVAALVCLSALFAGAAAAAEITVLSTPGPMPDVMGTLVPMFERASGHKVHISFKSGPDIAAQLKAGTPADLVIGGDEIFDDLIKDGLVGKDLAPLMISKVGVAVKAGAPKPDVSTPDKFKAALLAAKTVGYSRGASGQHFLTVIQRLGIADAVKAKAVIAQGEPVGAVIAKGQAEIGVQQVAELLPVPGIDFLGPLPGDLQKKIPYAAAITTKAKDAATAKALIAFLHSEAALDVLKKKGMDPA